MFILEKKEICEIIKNSYMTHESSQKIRFSLGCCGTSLWSYKENIYITFGTSKFVECLYHRRIA